MPIARIHGLDYLRGAMAVAVMLFHYDRWSGIIRPPSSPLAKLAFYAVCAFYVLSGLSLGVVYLHGLKNRADCGRFALRRIFRIVPLFWFVIAATILLEGSAASSGQILLNFSLLYSFFAPDRFLPTGSWSLGIEIVFYLLFPGLVYLAARTRWLFWGTLAASVAAFCVVGFNFDPQVPGRNQWVLYVQPIAHLAYFVAGVALAVLPRPNIPARTLTGCLAIVILAFCAYPLQHQQFAAVCGWARIALSGLCVACVYLFYAIAGWSQPWHAIGTFLGERCYGIYLLHPLVWLVVIRWLPDRGLAFPTAIAGTLIVSSLSWRYLEKPFISASARLTSRKSKEQGAIALPAESPADPKLPARPTHDTAN